MYRKRLARYPRLLLMAWACVAVNEPAMAYGHAVPASTVAESAAVPGAAAYARHCAMCHGAAAAGYGATAIPALAGQRRAYLIKRFDDILGDGDRVGGPHLAVSGPARDDPDVRAQIAGFLSELAPGQSPQTGDGRHARLGSAIFREQCQSCHREDARGDDAGVPSLRGQHYSYLVRALRDIETSHRGAIDESLVKFLGSLDEEEIAAVADYLSRLKAAAPGTATPATEATAP